MKAHWILAGLLLGTCNVAFAQMTPQMQQQLPPSDPNSPQYHSVYLPSLGLGDTVQPGERREPAWGAFANDVAKGWYASSVRKASKEEAERAALMECAKKGGLNCKVKFSFNNSCGAVASKQSGGVFWAYQPNLSEAVDNAMASCGSTECEIFFEECSYGDRIQ